TRCRRTAACPSSRRSRRVRRRWSRSGRFPMRGRSASTPSSPTPRSTGCSPRGACPSSRAARASTFAPRWPTWISRRRRRLGRWAAAYAANPAAVYAELADRDPETAAVVHANDRRRVVRALELTDAGSSLRRGDSRLWSEHTRHPSRIFGLDIPADVLDARIADRARAMLAAGAVEEARRALAGEVSTTARRMLGLEELAERGAEALDALIVGTRQFAAYQRKWMRRIPGIELIDGDRPADVIAKE